MRALKGSQKDVERFQAWQLATVAERNDDSDVLSIGPFRAVLSAATERPQTSWVTLIDGEATQAETVQALTKLKATLKKRSLPVEVEYNEAVFPKVGAWLEAAGLKLAERNPLMAVREDAFKPFVAADVTLTQLTPAAGEAELEAFQTIRWTDGGQVKRIVPAVAALQEEVARTSSVHLLAWVDWEPAGTGVSHALQGAAEIVGVVTRVDRRRRGIAATVTSELVRRHFAGGGDFVFLDAANDGAATVYERLGFSRFGANLVYR